MLWWVHALQSPFQAALQLTQPRRYLPEGLQSLTPNPPQQKLFVRSFNEAAFLSQRRCFPLG